MMEEQVSNYLAEFIESHKDKPFCRNMLNYSKLNHMEKLKVQSSFLTWLCIDNESVENDVYAEELTEIIYDFVFKEVDRFLDWIAEDMEKGE